MNLQNPIVEESCPHHDLLYHCDLRTDQPEPNGLIRHVLTINTRRVTYISRSLLTEPALWFHWLRFGSFLHTLFHLHVGLHLTDSGVTLLNSSGTSALDLLCMQVVSLLFCWGASFNLRVES